MAGGSWASFLEWRHFVRAAESGLGSPDTNPAALDEGPRLVQRPDPFGRQRHDHPPMIPDPALRVHFSLDETGRRPRAARGPMIRANRNRPEKNSPCRPSPAPASAPGSSSPGSSSRRASGSSPESAGSNKDCRPSRTNGEARRLAGRVARGHRRPSPALTHRFGLTGPERRRAPERLAARLRIERESDGTIHGVGPGQAEQKTARGGAIRAVISHGPDGPRTGPVQVSATPASQRSTWRANFSKSSRFSVRILASRSRSTSR